MVQSGEASASSANSSGNEGGGGHEADGGAVDWGSVLARQEAAFGEKVSGLERQLGESNEVLGRIKKAFAGGDDGGAADPHAAEIAGYEQFMDYFLQQGLEAERSSGGKGGIPLTVTIATKLAQKAIDDAKHRQKLEKQIADLQKKVNRHDDPEFQLADRAFTAMESMLSTGLEELFGQSAETASIRGAQFQAVANRITEEIRDLKREDPDGYRKLIGSPQTQRRMVNHFIVDMIPPAARQRMEHDRLMATEQSNEELGAAFQQARQHFEAAETLEEQAEWGRVLDGIRQELVGRQLGRRNPGGINQTLRRRA